MGGISGGRRRAFKSRHRAPMGDGGRLAVIFVSIALVVFVFAVMLGNHLRTISEGAVAEMSDSDTAELEIYYANAPEGVVARGIVFGVNYFPEDTEAVTSESVTDEVAVPETEADTAEESNPIKYDAVSVTLRKRMDDGRMALAYSSPISLEYMIDRVGEMPIDDGLKLISENWGSRTKICAVFEVDHPNRDEATGAIMRAYEIALICELVEAGVDEILLVGFGWDPYSGISFISDVYERVGRRSVIGLALPFDFITAYNSKENLIEIAEKCAFLAVDIYTPGVPALMTPEELIADRVLRVAEIRRELSMRILLGCGISPDGDSQTRTALICGAQNTMVGLGLPSETETIVPKTTVPETE